MSSKKRLLTTDLVQSILDSVHQYDLDHRELYILVSEIGKLYSTKANIVVQYFPQDMWEQIFQQGDLRETPFTDWLSYRTVCHAWNKTILNAKEFFLSASYSPARTLQLFPKLNSIDLHENTSIDPALLSGIKTLRLHGVLFGVRKNHQLETLTGLTSLSLHEQPRPAATALLPLTNLTDLSLDCRTVTSISTLTNLTRLNLSNSNIPWIDTIPLYRTLKSITTNQEGYFLFGQGTFTCGGVSYTGAWRTGKFHGKGTITTKSSSYTGDFVDGQFEGQGIYEEEGGERYEGALKAGKRHGFGIAVMKKNDGDEIYEGEWVSDRRVGKGISKYPNGEKYEGEVANGDPHGKGTYHYLNGDVFQGYFAYGMRQGRGTLTKADGKQFRGYWESNELLDPEG
jgi:hypothetical protein